MEDITDFTKEERTMACLLSKSSNREREIMEGWGQPYEPRGQSSKENRSFLPNDDFEDDSDFFSAAEMREKAKKKIEPVKSKTKKKKKSDRFQQQDFFDLLSTMNTKTDKNIKRKITITDPGILHPHKKFVGINLLSHKPSTLNKAEVIDILESTSIESQQTSTPNWVPHNQTVIQNQPHCLLNINDSIKSFQNQVTYHQKKWLEAELEVIHLEELKSKLTAEYGCRAIPISAKAQISLDSINGSDESPPLSPIVCGSHQLLNDEAFDKQDTVLGDQDGCTSPKVSPQLQEMDAGDVVDLNPVIVMNEELNDSVTLEQYPNNDDPSIEQNVDARLMDDKIGNTSECLPPNHHLLNCWEWNEITGQPIPEPPSIMVNGVNQRGWKRYVPLSTLRAPKCVKNVIQDFLKFMDSNTQVQKFFDFYHADHNLKEKPQFLETILMLDLKKIRVSTTRKGITIKKTNDSITQWNDSTPEFQLRRSNMKGKRRTIAELVNLINLNGRFGYLGPGTFWCRHCIADNNLKSLVTTSNEVQYGPQKHQIVYPMIRLNCYNTNVVYLLHCSACLSQGNFTNYVGQNETLDVSRFHGRASKHVSKLGNEHSVYYHFTHVHQKSDRRYTLLQTGFPSLSDRLAGERKWIAICDGYKYDTVSSTGNLNIY